MTVRPALPSRSTLSSSARWLQSSAKRATDVTIGVLALGVTGPVMAIGAAAVLLTLGRPVTFRQERAGWAGQPIEVRKLRTMSDVRDATGRLLPDAERLTRTGMAMRSFSIDELPQLVAVVKGDMAVVGPRPLPMAYVSRYDDRQRRRLEARPGLTGWSQVNGRNTLSWPCKLELDVWYVEHASWRLDWKVLRKTIGALVSRRGVNAVDHATMREFIGER